MSLIQQIKRELKRNPHKKTPRKTAVAVPRAAPDLKKIVLVLLEGIKLDAKPHQLAILLTAENLVPITGATWTIQSVGSALTELKNPRSDLYATALDLATRGELSYQDFRLLCQRH